MDLEVKQGAECIKDTLFRLNEMLGQVDLLLVDVQGQVVGIVYLRWILGTRRTKGCSQGAQAHV